MQIVEREQERPARSEVRRQPVETVQRRQRRVPRRLPDRNLGGIEERRRKRRRARKQLGSFLLAQRGEERLEELTHDAVRKRALELGAARTKHLQAGLLTKRLRLRQQNGLADARRPLDRQQPPAVGERVDQAAHRSQLGLALEQIELDSERLRSTS